MSSSPAHKEPRPRSAILAGGLIAGALDITYASLDGLVSGRTVPRTLQSVASGLLGRDAFQGGWLHAGLGLLLHFCIAVGAAAIYYAISRRMTVLVKRPWLGGLIFGVGVYFFMNQIVVPLSAAPFHIPFQITGLLVHMVFIGLPIALSVRRFAGWEKRNPPPSG
jgi:hypothetical protein